MPQSKQRLAQLRSQFPFIRNIEGHWNTPKLQVSVRVQRADHSLFYFKGEYHDGNRSSFGWQGEEDLTGRSSDHAWAISKSRQPLEVLARVSWDDVRYTHFLKELMFESVRPEDIGHIVTIRVIDWHQRNDTDTACEVDTWLGEWHHRELEIIIYQRPKVGFTRLLEEADLTQNVELTSHQVMSLFLERRDMEVVSSMLQSLAQRFETEVFSRGLGKVLDESPVTGLSGLLGGVKLLTLASAGRRMFTLRQGDDSITFIGWDEPGDDGRVHLGYQGICATLAKATDLVERVINAWADLDNPEDVMIDDRKVSFF